MSVVVVCTNVVRNAVIGGVLVECRDVQLNQHYDCCGTFVVQYGKIACNECGVEVREPAEPTVDPIYKLFRRSTR